MCPSHVHQATTCKTGQTGTLPIVVKVTCTLTGEYAGFDEKQLTCQNGGKGQVMAEIKKAHDM